jgi:L-ascorbate metabolism protein UlaG (beta-lactamase superfamily)
MSLLKGTSVTWLGHATVLVTTAAGVHLIIDPFLTHNPKFPKGFELPGKLDYILLTHAHFDHIADAIPLAAKSGAKVVAIVELAGYLESKGVKEVIAMNLGGTLDLPGVAVTMVEARHTSSVDEEPSRNVGVPAGYVLTIANGPVLYHAGDTAVFGDMALIRELYAPEIAMLPMGGYYTMGPKEAAVAVRLLQPKLILPLHWGTFPQLTGTPQQLAELIDEPERVARVEPGEALKAV